MRFFRRALVCALLAVPLGGATAAADAELLPPQAVPSPPAHVQVAPPAHVQVAPPQAGSPVGATHVPVAPPRAQATALPRRADTHVYLLRGLFGVFSLGMDSLADQLKANGYRSDIYAWDSWPQVAATVTQRYQDGHRGPVVVIGHSLGANAVISVADQLQGQSIPVQMGVTFDATDPAPVPQNVAVFINFWARDGFGRPVNAAPGYAGQLTNFDLSNQPGIDHTSIDSLDRFHQFVIAQLEAMTGP